MTAQPDTDADRYGDATSLPYCVTITKPGLPTVHLGYPFKFQVEMVARKLEMDQGTARPAGTTFAFGPTPADIRPLSPIDTAEAAAVEIMREPDDLDLRYPDTWSRVSAQHVDHDARQIWRAALGMTEGPESDDQEPARTPDVSFPISRPGTGYDPIERTVWDAVSQAVTAVNIKAAIASGSADVVADLVERAVRAAFGARWVARPGTVAKELHALDAADVAVDAAEALDGFPDFGLVTYSADPHKDGFTVTARPLDGLGQRRFEFEVREL
ncbi:hypothetical protein [Saccharothrix hoggarensis]|uniref:Uncharacterized protein n=1 Tax=Saccharothrix hoggarensis TaxID=913853 RepID=A0ABW3QIN9_9PSEU